MSIAPITTPVYVTAPLSDASLETPGRIGAGLARGLAAQATLTVLPRQAADSTTSTTPVQLQAPALATELTTGIAAACSQLAAPLPDAVINTYADMASIMNDFDAALQSGTPLTADQLAALESRADAVVRTLTDIVTNSTYPTFTDFLKDLINIAQELRQLMSEMKAEAIQGKFDLQVAAADKRLQGAEKERDAAVTSAKADRTDAWASFAGALVGGGMGAAYGGGNAVATASINQMWNSLITSPTKAATSNDRIDAANTRLEGAGFTHDADIMDARAGLKDAEIGKADDLRTSMATLRDTMLRLLSDLIAAQQGALRAANSV